MRLGLNNELFIFVYVTLYILDADRGQLACFHVCSFKRLTTGLIVLAFA